MIDHDQVTTSDGYILSMQRIPASRSGKKANKPPVLLQHGLYVARVTHGPLNLENNSEL